MVVTISGTLGAGKTNVIKDLYHILNPKFFTDESVKKSFMGMMNITEEEFYYRLANDDELFTNYRDSCDNHILNVIKENISDFRTDHDILIDSLVAHDIYDASNRRLDDSGDWINIRLICDDKEAVTRIKKSGYKTVVTTNELENIVSKITEKEILMYKELYGWNLNNELRYDLLIDTMSMTSKDTVRVILDYLNEESPTTYRPLIAEDLRGKETLILRNGDTLEMKNGLLLGIEYRLQREYDYNLKSRLNKDYDVVNIIRDGKPLLSINSEY